MRSGWLDAKVCRASFHGSAGVDRCGSRFFADTPASQIGRDDTIGSKLHFNAFQEVEGNTHWSMQAGFTDDFVEMKRPSIPYQEHHERSHNVVAALPNPKCGESETRTYKLPNRQPETKLLPMPTLIRPSGTLSWRRFGRRFAIHSCFCHWKPKLVSRASRREALLPEQLLAISSCDLFAFPYPARPFRRLAYSPLY